MDDAVFASINASGGVDYAPHNRGITPVFFIEPVPDPIATEKAGHPVSRDMERVRLYIVGDSLSAAAHPVDESIKRRFPEEYEKWKRTKEGIGVKGMRLQQWPMATPAMIAELSGLNIFSVEDLAAVSDANIQNIVDGRAIREKAIAYLKAATDSSAVMRYAAEAQRLRDEVAQLRRMIENGGFSEKELRAEKKKAKSKRAPMSAERRAEIGARLKAGREAKKNLEDLGVARAPDYPE